MKRRISIQRRVEAGLKIKYFTVNKWHGFDFTALIDRHGFLLVFDVVCYTVPVKVRSTSHAKADVVYQTPLFSIRYYSRVIRR